MKRCLAFLFLAACTACASQRTIADNDLDPSSHQERVATDVSAILHGMASAHRGEQIVFRALPPGMMPGW